MRWISLLVMIASSVAGFSDRVAPAAPSGGKEAANVHTQLGHTGEVFDVAFSPDGKFAISGGFDKTLKLWEVATGRELRSFTGHTGQVNFVAFSPDGKLALSGGGDIFKTELKLWEVATGRELRSFDDDSVAPSRFIHAAIPNSVAFSPDGKFALYGGSGLPDPDGPGIVPGSQLKLWDVATGRKLRNFVGHAGDVNSVAISPDGKFALSGGGNVLSPELKLWDVATGRELRSFVGHAGTVASVAFSPDGKFALSRGSELKLWDVATGRELRSLAIRGGSSWALSRDHRFAIVGGGDYLNTRGELTVWDIATGRQLRSFAGHAGNVYSVAFSPDDQFVLSASADHTLKLWDPSTGRELRSFTGHTYGVNLAAFSPDGQFALSANVDNRLDLWELATGRRLRSLVGHNGAVLSVAFSRDGKFALSGSDDYALKLWDVASGRELRTFGGHDDPVGSIAISPDGRFALSGSGNVLRLKLKLSSTLKLWDVATGRELRAFAGEMGDVYSVAISPDGRFGLSGSYDAKVRLWELASGRELRSFAGHNGGVYSVAFSPDGRFALSGSTDKTMKLWELTSGRELRSFAGHTSFVNSVAFSPDGQFALSGSWDKTMKLWELATGRELRSFAGHSDFVHSATFSPNGQKILSASRDGTVRLWDPATSQELATMLASKHGEHLAITPEGFFTASQRDTDMLAIVRGLEITSIGQVYQSLFNPDLVRETLAGDRSGEVARAAKVINLDEIIDAGPPPDVAITSHVPGSGADKDVVTVSARITDRGKGIGRIEWRVNGLTAGVTSAPAGHGRDFDASQKVALDHGDNRIEVIAYESRNLLASRPARTTIVDDHPAEQVKPKLYVLAVGVNQYEDKGSTTGDFGYFPPLGLAVADALAFGDEMRNGGTGLYSDVIVKFALNSDATPAKLDQLVTQMGAEISPRDIFVFYAAGHGYSKDGHFYLIPQDYQGGADPHALKARAIDQDRLQGWLANRIKAKKALILLDTCQSGSVIGGYARPRTEGAASEAAVGRLHEAIGHPILTAAAADEFAREGYKGHGVFTYALIEALHTGDTNNNGKIELTELAAHVQRRVPQLTAELDKNEGVVKGVAVIAMRGGEGDKQSARFGSTGEDFAIVARRP